MAKNSKDLAYEPLWTKEEWCKEASERFTKHFGFEVLITQDNAAKALYAMEQHKTRMKSLGEDLSLNFSMAMIALHGAANGGPLRGM